MNLKAESDRPGTRCIVRGESRHPFAPVNHRQEKCIDLYDRPTTFFFIDSPYTECGATMYASWTNTDVQILRDCLARLRGRWIVTMNDTAAIRAIFAGCIIKAVERAKGINAKAKDRVYREIIITPAI